MWNSSVKYTISLNMCHYIKLWHPQAEKLSLTVSNLIIIWLPILAFAIHFDNISSSIVLSVNSCYSGDFRSEKTAATASIIVLPSTD